MSSKLNQHDFASAYKKSWCDDRQQAAGLIETDLFSDLSLVSKGLLNNLLNPKALLFFSLFLPQFTTTNGTITTQIVILGLIFLGLATRLGTSK